tara:strand:+ start:3513 stop:4043 length:531 start_codon:yes stop_codon:yes gene_type:complete
MSRFVDTVVAYRLLRLLATPIERTSAFQLGIIDRDGKKLKEPQTSQEMDAYSLLQRFVFKVQRSLMKSPDRNARRLLTFAAAMAILKEYTEEDENNVDALLEVFEKDEDVIKQAELLESSNLISFNNFIGEDMAANNAGGGAIHGIGVGPKGEPGRDPRLMPLARRRKKKRESSGK